MNFIVFTAIVIYFTIFQINCRSLELDIDDLSRSEVREDKDLINDSEISGIFSWKRLKPILRREIQRIRNVKGTDASTLNQETAETTTSIQVKEDGNLSSEHLDKDEDISSKHEMTNVSIVKSDSTDNSQHEEAVDETDMEEELISSMKHDEMPQLDHSLNSNNFSDSVIMDILNQTTDSILFQALNDNGSTIDSLEFDETSVLSQGGHVATLQEVSTMGFELLIDSETKQNLLLTELINSQSDLTDDFTDEDDSDFTTLEFNYTNEEDESISDTTDLNTDEDDSDFTTLEFNYTNEEDESISDTTDLNTDEDDSDFTTLKLNHNNEISEQATTINEEITDLHTDEIQTENTEFSTREIEDDDENELELSNSVQEEDGTERSNTELEHPMCPEPGWCVFWFFALDTCAKDSHCHGSRICCTVGCSKTCIDVDR